MMRMIERKRNGKESKARERESLELARTSSHLVLLVNQQEGDLVRLFSSVEVKKSIFVSRDTSEKHTPNPNHNVND